MSDSPYLEKLEPGSSHALLRTWLARLPEGQRVLDIGAAEGTLGKMLAGKDFQIWGVEPNPAWAARAQPFYSGLFEGRLEDAPDEFLGGFDVVVCADVLEHLPDPHTQLARLARLQKPGTLMMVCVPNVANLWIRLQLLAGKFDYGERGILDRTHLRFFTFASFRAMLEDCAIEILKILPTPVPLGLVAPRFYSTVPGKIATKILYCSTLLLPRILGYQFFAICRVRN